jgi:uncharacterized protein YjbI with pentapeptide repeats
MPKTGGSPKERVGSDRMYRLRATGDVGTRHRGRRRCQYGRVSARAARAPAAPSLPVELEPTELGDGVLVDEARLEGLELTGGLPPGTVARSTTLAGCRVRGSLAGARLHSLHALDVAIAGSDLANADLRGGAVTRATVTQSRLTGAQLLETSLRDVTLDGCRLDFSVLAGARIERVLFRDCDLREVTLEQAQLRDVRFERCDLSGAALGQARLQRVEFDDCRLDGVREIGDLRGARMPLSDIVAHAGAFAAALGIGVIAVDEDD